MKISKLAVLAAALALTVPAFANPNATGSWEVALKMPSGSGTPRFELTQKGEVLTGKYVGRLGESPVSGTVKGQDVTFSYKSTFPGAGEFVTVYTGKIDGNSIQGAVSMGPSGQFGTGTFTAKRVGGEATK